MIITTEDGTVITTEDGRPLATDDVKTNNDIQELDFSVDLLKALLWQYNDAANLQSLLNSKQDWYDVNQRDFWQNWYSNVFNLMTANQFGLTVWSIILNIPLFITTPPDPDHTAIWGFGPNNKNFGNGNFATPTGGTSKLPLETKRLALKLRYFQLVTSGTVPEVNRFLSYLFGEGQAYLADNKDMTQLYIFRFPLTWDLKYVFDNFDVLPRPAGVGSSYRDATQKVWGFGPNRVNFGNGGFGA